MSFSPEKPSDIYDLLKSGRLSFNVEAHEIVFLKLQDLVGWLKLEESESKYFGDLVNDQPEGYGVMFYPGFLKMYAGEWLKGQPHGRGFMHYARRKYYVGEWKNGLRHGDGITVFGKRTSGYEEWKGRYENDRWEGEDDLEEKARQRYPREHRFGLNENKEIDRKIELLEQIGEEERALRLRMKMGAYKYLHRGLELIWQGFSDYYPLNYPKLNTLIKVKSEGIWCEECNEFIDRSARGECNLPDVIFKSVLPALEEFRLSQIKSGSRKVGLEGLSEEHFNLNQGERFADIYAFCYAQTNRNLSQRFLLQYINTSGSFIERHLLKHHQWESVDSTLLFEKMAVSEHGLELVFRELEPKFI